MVQRRVKICDYYWTVRVVSLEEMIEQTGDSNTAGLTMADTRTILINEDSINFRVMAHELFHAYFHYLHLSDTDDMPLDQVEEIMANWLPAHGETLIRKAKRLTKDLQKGMNSNGEKK
jgi:hypothetical protein